VAKYAEAPGSGCGGTGYGAYNCGMAALPELRAAVPPLESGDRLSRREFHDRYCLHPEIKKAELIDGVVYVSSPVSLDHAIPHGIVVGWLDRYARRRRNVHMADNVTVFLPGDAEVQPDACLWREGGNARATPEGYLEGAPELVVEVAASSASYDLNVKKDAYRRAGVGEYIAWQVYEGQIDWFVLREGRYEVFEAGERGVIESTQFAGLRLDPRRWLKQYPGRAE
jgi:Uma2 family endonuclease